MFDGRLYTRQSLTTTDCALLDSRIEAPRLAYGFWQPWWCGGYSAGVASSFECTAMHRSFPPAISQSISDALYTHQPLWRARKIHSIFVKWKTHISDDQASQTMLVSDRNWRALVNDIYIYIYAKMTKSYRIQCGELGGLAVDRRM